MNNTPESNDLFGGSRGKKIRSYFSRVGGGVAIMMLVTVALQYLLVWAVNRWAPGLRDAEWFLWALSLAPMYLVGVPALLLTLRRVPSLPPERSKLKPGHWILLLLMSIGIMYAGNYIGNILMLVINSATGNDASNAIADMLSGSNLIINAIATVLLAPIVEEYVFRKVIIDRTRAYGEKTAMLLSALLFGLFHGNLYQFFYAFGLGLILGFVYLRTGKVKNTIFLHMSINFLGGVVAPYVVSLIDTELLEKAAETDIANTLADPEALNEFMQSIAPALPGLMVFFLYSMLFAGAAIAGLILLLVFRKKMKLVRAEFELPRDMIGSTVYMNTGVAAAIIACTAIVVLSLF